MFDRIAGICRDATTRAVLLLAGAALVAACSSEPEEQPPHAAALSSIQAIKDNDLRAFLIATMGDEQYRELGAKWDETRQRDVSDEDRSQFELMLKMVTAPDAEDRLISLIEPQLVQWRPQMKEMIFGLQAFATLQLQNMSELDAEQRKMLTRGVQSLTEWVRNNDLTSVESARRAIAIATKTMRDLDLDSIDEVNALDYDALLGKGGAILAGLKQVLAVYGIEIDEMLGSVDAETVDQQGDRATIRVSFDFFGTRQQAQTELVRVDGQWLSEDAVRGAQDAMSGQLTAMASPGPAGSPDAAPPAPAAPSSSTAPAEQTEANAAPPDAKALPAEFPPSAVDARPATGGDPAEVYLAYREALAGAARFEDIEPFWARWVGITAATQDAAVKQRKLEQLRTLATDAEVLASEQDMESARLTVSGTRDGGESMRGTVVLVNSSDGWRIDSIDWSAPAREPLAIVTEPADEAPAVASVSTETTAAAQRSSIEPVSTVTVPAAQAPSAERRDSPPIVPTPGVSRSETEDATVLARVAPAATPDETPAATPDEAPAATPDEAPATVALAMDKDALQKSFDGNPFLNHYGMKFNVLELSQGFATVELANGPAELLSRLRQGVDLTALDPLDLDDGRERQALTALRKLSDTLVSNGNVAALLIVPPRPAAAQTAEPGVSLQAREAPPAADAEGEDSRRTAMAPSAEQAQRQQARERRRSLVRAIQEKLAELGYQPGPADGIAGRGTRAAISEYQRAANLLADGEPSDDLRAHLYSDRAVAKVEPQPVAGPEPEPVTAEVRQEPEKRKLGDRIGGFFKKLLKPRADGDDTSIPESETVD